MFAMGNTEKKSKNSDTEFHDMEDLSKLKNAVRALRAAMASVHPWNCSIDALESFLIQTSFCSTDLHSFDKQVSILTKFKDYVLIENANRWRDMEPFLSTRDLRATWSDFFSQKSASHQKKQSASNQQPRQQNNKKNVSYNSQSSYRPPHTQPTQQHSQPLQSGSNPSSRYQAPAHLFLDDIC